MRKRGKYRGREKRDRIERGREGIEGEKRGRGREKTR